MNNIHTEIDKLGEILFTFGAKVGASKDSVFVGKDNIDWAKAQIETLLLDAQAEGYKRGYIAGGIEEFNKGQKNE